ncbi:HAMP domain-containing histidine kinase [Sphingomonas sp. A2-49]|uniref:sensor histidine kinase n=1 Tax=Sphingomonas sp. A2-49 TaxID=1391375 RepID=UPI0021CF8DF1|nr:HAMP domain-containing sensor histidine kinase [Sphingomonas sp. A2-49]MCU6456006.1 HAMP domain-containing histidine kinase [Sphingomonas sp. A2-49]
MTTTTQSRWAAWGWVRQSLFWRVFLVMLLSVAAVQALNVALVVFITPPTPRIYSVPQVVTALRTGADASGELLLAHDATNPEPFDERGTRVGRLIATQLGIPEERVRVHFGGPPPMFFAAMPRREGRPQPPHFPDARNQILFGHFAVSVRQSDASWVTARAARTGFESWRWRAFLWLLAAMLAVGPFAWLLARRLTKPIAAFGEAAERLGRDPRAAPVPLGGPAEIADAAAAFNRMQARLNRYVEDRTTMIAAIAHDLRTPLMRLGLRLEGAPEPLRTQSEGDIRDMQAMIQAALAFFRDETRMGERRRLDLRSLVESVTDDLADRGEPVTLHDGAPLVVAGDAAGLKALVANLVGNALKYAGDAEVTLSQADGHAVIAVRDHGAGIDPDDLDRLFEPFFRGERSRNRDTGGIGLGLSSVRGVARAHGGDAAIANHPDGGAVATVTLPL